MSRIDSQDTPEDQHNNEPAPLPPPNEVGIAASKAGEGDAPDTAPSDFGPGFDAYFEAINHALTAFLNNHSWSETRAILELEQSLLMTDIVEDILTTLIEEARQSNSPNGQQRVGYLILHLKLLQEAQVDGISAAWKSFMARLGSNEQSSGGGGDEDLLSIWLDILNPRLGRRFLELHLELLHTNSDIALESKILDLQASLAEIRQSGGELEQVKESIHNLREHLNLLRDARSRGSSPEAVRAAYVNAFGGFTLDMPSWIEELIQQVSVLMHSGPSAKETTKL